MLWIVIIILLYILYEWEMYVKLLAMTAIVNKLSFKDSTILFRFILVIIIGILVRFALTS